MFDIDTMGPVDVAIIGFEGATDRRGVAAAVLDLAERGVVRILDLAWAAKSAEGDIEVLEVTDSELAEAFAAVTDRAELLNDDDLVEVAEGLEPGTAALLVVWENTWAAPFATAMREANGELLVFERVPRDAVVTAMEALNQALEDN
jgi:hypothetical protein